MSTNQPTIDKLGNADWKASDRPRERSSWRRRLAETERGFTACFRANSSMFFYFFTTCTIISIAFVLGLSGLEWALLSFAITTALCSEVLHFSIQKILEQAQEQIPRNIHQFLTMTRAAFMLLLGGSSLTILILLGSKFLEVYYHNF